MTSAKSKTKLHITMLDILPWTSKRAGASESAIIQQQQIRQQQQQLQQHQQQVAEQQFREFLESCSKSAAAVTAARTSTNKVAGSKGLSRSASDVKYLEKKPSFAARRVPKRSNSILVQSRGSVTATNGTSNGSAAVVGSSHQRHQLAGVSVAVGRSSVGGSHVNGDHGARQQVLGALSTSSSPSVRVSAGNVVMVSRRRILSRSRDDLSSGGGEFVPYEEEEDVWYQREKLYRDHIQEVLEKWEQIDDEIWAKVIVLERNRRVAKAYARAPVLTINGSDEGFDGFRIGLGGFDNPWRDPKTEEIQRLIGHGVKLKMDDGGNILVKRIAKSNVYVKQTLEETAVGSEVLKLPQGCLELDKPVKLFDFKKFQQNMSRELKRAYPDRRKLEWQCLSALVFVRQEPDLLDCPQWVMLINMVAMDLLKSKLPPVKRMPDPKAMRPRLPLPDEDPYSLASGGSGSGSGSGSSGASGREFKRGDRPPKLPPRDSDLIGRQHYNIPKPDYEDELEKKFAQAMSGRMAERVNNKQAKEKKHEDPYYCGLRARVSNFAGKGPKKDRNLGRPLPNPAAPAHHLMHHPVIHHSRSYDSGMGTSHYSYGHDVVPPAVTRGAQYEVRYDPKYDVIRRKLVGPTPPPPPHPPGACISNGNNKLVHPCFTAPNGFNGNVGPAGRGNRDLSGGESPYEKIYGRLPLPNRAYVPAKSRTLFPNGWE